MAERRNRKHSKIDALPPDIKAAVEPMMLGADIYDDIVAYLREPGLSLIHILSATTTLSGMIFIGRSVSLTVSSTQYWIR